MNSKDLALPPTSTHPPRRVVDLAMMMIIDGTPMLVSPRCREEFPVALKRETLVKYQECKRSNICEE